MSPTPTKAKKAHHPRYPVFKVVGRTLEESLELALLAAEADTVESFLELPEGLLLLSGSPQGATRFRESLEGEALLEWVEVWLSRSPEECHEVYFGGLERFHSLGGEAVALVAPCGFQECEGVFEVEGEQ